MIHVHYSKYTVAGIQNCDVMRINHQPRSTCGGFRIHSHGQKLLYAVLLFAALNLLFAPLSNVYANRGGRGTGAPCVPVGDLVYEFLEHCAVRGLIPLSTTTKQPITRLQVAEYLLDIAGQYHKIDDEILKADLEYYLREFAWDIERIKSDATLPKRRLRSTAINVSDIIGKPHRHLSCFRAEKFSFVFDPVIWGGYDIEDEHKIFKNIKKIRFIGDGKKIFRRATGIQFRGYIRGWLGYYFRFVDHVERGNGPYTDRSQLLEDRYGYVGPLSGGKEVYYDLTEAYITAGWKGFSLVFGKDRVKWGAGHSDRLMFSGQSPSFDQLRISIKLYDKANFTSVVGRLHPWSVAGDTLYQTVEGWTRIIPAQKWLSAHRLEYAPCKWLLFGVQEVIIWGDRGLEIAYLNPLNFLFSAEHNSGDLDNVMMAGDVTVQIAERGKAYASLIIDDLKTSSIGEGDPGNKVGLLCGAWFSDLWFDGVECWIEYTRLEPYVYTHFYPVNRFTTWTSSLGSNLPPNSDRFEVGVKYRPRRDLHLNLQVLKNRHGSTGGDVCQTVPRGRKLVVYFLDGDRSEWTTIKTSVRWEVKTGLLVEVGYIAGDQSTVLQDRFFFSMGYRY